MLTKSHTHSRFDGCIPGGVRVRSTNVGFILISLFAFRAPSDSFSFPVQSFQKLLQFFQHQPFQLLWKIYQLLL